MWDPLDVCWNMIHFTRRTWESTTIYVIGVIQTPKVESLRHSKLVCGTKVATLRWGHLSFFGWFFSIFLGTHIWLFHWDLWWPASRAIYEPTHRRCHLFLESSPWMVKVKAQEMLEMLETSLGDVTAKWALFFLGDAEVLRKPNRDCENWCWKVWGVWSVRIGK